MILNKISNAQIKQTRLLHLKKYRQKYNQFIVEGIKSVDEFVKSGLKSVAFYGNESYLQEQSNLFGQEKCFITNTKQLSQITCLKSAQEVLAVFEIPTHKEVDRDKKFILALDDIRDPGNLGTIIRTADWFGLKEIVCSSSSADCYNPKVVQASMGSMSRIKVHYKDLDAFMDEMTAFDIVIADMNGTDYRTYEYGKSIIVIGNEGKGVSSYIQEKKNQKITIPRIGGAESLNAAISTAIILSNIS